MELGLGQAEFGKKVDRAWRTIQSIELGTLPLSAKLAERISEETGVNFNWLMDGDADAPILDERGLPWKKEAFFDAQGKKMLPGSTLGRHYAVDLLVMGIAEVCAAVVAASESKNIRAYVWRLSNGIAKAVNDLKNFPELAEEFRNIKGGNFKNTERALEAVVGTALERCRKWREPRRRTGKRKK